MNNYQKNPLKLYIQDIFRAKRTKEKYIYEIFGLTFKNLMIHGVVTCIYNRNSTTTNLEVSDATGSVQIYFDSTKNNFNVNDKTVKELLHDLSTATKCNNENIQIMSKLVDSIIEKKNKPIDFQEGNYVCIVGDIFLDDFKNSRMVSAYECNVSSVERDVVWMEELKYLYEKFYLWNKE